jgi:hypothetical protein
VTWIVLVMIECETRRELPYLDHYYLSLAIVSIPILHLQHHRTVALHHALQHPGAIPSLILNPKVSSEHSTSTTSKLYFNTSLTLNPGHLSLHRLPKYHSPQKFAAVVVTHMTSIFFCFAASKPAWRGCAVTNSMCPSDLRRP